MSTENELSVKQAIAQSNPNPSLLCDEQSKSNSFNGLTIQSKSNHNPTTFGKRYGIENIKWPNIMMKP